MIGPHRVAQQVRLGARVRHVTDPLTALRAACASLGIRRLGFFSPYVASVSDAMRAALEASGLSIAAFGSFEEESDERIARIDAASILAAGLSVGRAGGSEALFLSCTNLRAAALIGEMEAALGIPVIASNQALAWHMMRLAGLETDTIPAGRLMRAPLPTAEPEPA